MMKIKIGNIVTTAKLGLEGFSYQGKDKNGDDVYINHLCDKKNKKIIVQPISAGKVLVKKIK